MTANLTAIYDGENLFVKGEVVPKYIYDGNKRRENITSVIFNEGIQRIGHSAFLGCSLNDVMFLEDLDDIYPTTTITFPDCLKEIDTAAFSRCPLVSVSFSHGLQRIGNQAFAQCRLLTSVSFSHGLQRIGYLAFNNCHLLTSVFLPDSSIDIDRNAFYGCTALESLRAASGHSSIVSYLRFQSTVRQRVTVLVCLQSLRNELYGGKYVAVESNRTTPTGGIIEGKLAFQMIESDDLWRCIIEFL
jgi:hypothetical protein